MSLTLIAGLVYVYVVLYRLNNRQSIHGAVSPFGVFLHLITVGFAAYMMLVGWGAENPLDQFGVIAYVLGGFLGLLDEGTKVQKNHD